MSLVLVVDIGTSNIKAGIVNRFGEVLSYSERENPILRPEKGAAEHDPIALYERFLDISREVLKDYKDNVSLIALSAYQLGLLPISKDGKPLMNIMTLLDTRPQKTFAEWSKDIDRERLYKNTGCSITSLYPLSKIMWLKKERRDLFENTAYFLSSKGWIMYKLTHDIITEPSIASATQFFNMEEMKWDPYALSIAEISEEKLPKVVWGNEIYGKISKDVRKDLGLSGDVELLPGVYDGGGILIGVGGLEKNIGVVNLGTSAMVRIVSPTPILDAQMRLQTYAFYKNMWLTGAGINNAGIALKWLKHSIVGEKSYTELVKEAEGVPEGAEGLYFLPYLSGERDPRIGNLASGVIFGIREYHKRRHIVRAVLEGVAYTARFVIDALSDNNVPVNEIRIGGSGAKSPLWLKIFSDVLDLPVRRAKTENTVLVGEALLGFVAKGLYKDYEEATSFMVRLDDPLLPSHERVGIYDRYYSFYKDIVYKMKSLYDEAGKYFKDFS